MGNVFSHNPKPIGVEADIGFLFSSEYRQQGLQQQEKNALKCQPILTDEDWVSIMDKGPSQWRMIPISTDGWEDLSRASISAKQNADTNSSGTKSSSSDALTPRADQTQGPAKDQVCSSLPGAYFCEVECQAGCESVRFDTMQTEDQLFREGQLPEGSHLTPDLPNFEKWSVMAQARALLVKSAPVVLQSSLPLPQQAEAYCELELLSFTPFTSYVALGVAVSGYPSGHLPGVLPGSCALLSTGQVYNGGTSSVAEGPVLVDQMVAGVWMCSHVSLLGETKLRREVQGISPQPAYLDGGCTLLHPRTHFHLCQRLRSVQEGDVIGCLFCRKAGQILFFLNGEPMWHVECPEIVLSESALKLTPRTYGEIQPRAATGSRYDSITRTSHGAQDMFVTIGVIGKGEVELNFGGKAFNLSGEITRVSKGKVQSTALIAARAFGYRLARFHVLLDELTLFYSCFNPPMVPKAKGMVVLNISRLEDFNAELKQTYGKDLSDVRNHAREINKRKLWNFFRQHDPRRLSQVDRIFNDFDGDSWRLNEFLRKTYGSDMTSCSVRRKQSIEAMLVDYFSLVKRRQDTFKIEAAAEQALNKPSVVDKALRDRYKQGINVLLRNRLRQVYALYSPESMKELDHLVEKYPLFDDAYMLNTKMQIRFGVDLEAFPPFEHSQVLPNNTHRPPVRDTDRHTAGPLDIFEVEIETDDMPSLFDVHGSTKTNLSGIVGSDAAAADVADTRYGTKISPDRKNRNPAAKRRQRSRSSLRGSSNVGTTSSSPPNVGRYFSSSFAEKSGDGSRRDSKPVSEGQDLDILIATNTFPADGPLGQRAREHRSSSQTETPSLLAKGEELTEAAAEQPENNVSATPVMEKEAIPPAKERELTEATIDQPRVNVSDALDDHSTDKQTNAAPTAQESSAIETNADARVAERSFEGSSPGPADGPVSSGEQHLDSTSKPVSTEPPSAELDAGFGEQPRIASLENKEADAETRNESTGTEIREAADGRDTSGSPPQAADVASTDASPGENQQAQQAAEAVMDSNEPSMQQGDASGENGLRYSAFFSPEELLRDLQINHAEEAVETADIERSEEPEEASDPANEASIKSEKAASGPANEASIKSEEEVSGPAIEVAGAPATMEDQALRSEEPVQDSDPIPSSVEHPEPMDIGSGTDPAEETQEEPQQD